MTMLNKVIRNTLHFWLLSSVFMLRAQGSGTEKFDFIIVL